MLSRQVRGEIVWGFWMFDNFVCYLRSVINK